MTTHLVGFCHLSRERHQSDRPSVVVFLLRYDREEKQTWGNRFQSVSKMSPDWKKRYRALLMLFSTQSSSEGETPLSSIGTSKFICLFVYLFYCFDLDSSPYASGS